MTSRRITQIAVPGSSGRTPTGALQFQDDWPGLFIRGDDAIALAGVIRQLSESLAGHPDQRVSFLISRLAAYRSIIEQDVIVRRDRGPDA